MFNNRHRYILDTPITSPQVLNTDPMDWDDTETEIGRSEKTFGIFLTISNNLKFTGKTKELLETVYSIYGLQSLVKLTKQLKHPKTDEWQLSFTGYLDFSTRKIEDNKLSIECLEGGLREILVSQLKEKFELDRRKTINGAYLPELKTDEIVFKGRDIYLLSKLASDENGQFFVKSGKWKSGNEYREVFQPFPMSIIANSDKENLATPLESSGAEKADSEGANTMFYFNADRDRGEVKLKFNTSFRIVPLYESGSGDTYEIEKYSVGSNGSNITIDVILKRYNNGNQFDVVEETLIENIAFINVLGNGDPAIGATYDIEYSGSIEPKINESFAIGIKMRGRYGNIDEGYFFMLLDNYTASLSLQEDSFFRITNAKFMRAYDVGSRLTEIYTGRNKFKSDLLNSGEWENLGFTNGGWVRNLKEVNEEEVLEDYPLTIDFEDLYKSVNAVTPVGYGIETNGAAQKIVLEAIDYFFQRYVTIKLDQVSKVKRNTASELIYSSLTFGYEKGGNYEAPLGLDEFNIQSTFISPVTDRSNKYEASGSSRADSYAVEQARRYQYEDYPDQDTEFDRDNILIDAKYLTRSNLKNYFEPRLWQDDFESIPTGVYSPDTAFNLRLSPANNRNRHAKMFKGDIYKTPNKEILHASSKGNSQLKTQLIGKTPIKEDEDILISELSNPLFEPEWIEFEYPKSQALIDQIQGKTKINDKEINNYYGQVEFVNENGQKERGYLFSAKIKDVISFKILKTYGF